MFRLILLEVDELSCFYEGIWSNFPTGHFKKKESETSNELVIPWWKDLYPVGKSAFIVVHSTFQKHFSYKLQRYSSNTFLITANISKALRGGR